MNDDNTRKLFKRFSFLSKANLSDGFGCGDGWYKLVYDMCKSLKEVNPPNDFAIIKIAERHNELEVHSKNGVMRTRVVIDEFNTASIEVCAGCGNNRDLEQCDKCIVPVIEYPEPEEDEQTQCTNCSTDPCACPAGGCSSCSSGSCNCP